MMRKVEVTKLKERERGVSTSNFDQVIKSKTLPHADDGMI